MLGFFVYAHQRSQSQILAAYQSDCLERPGFLAVRLSVLKNSSKSGTSGRAFRPYILLKILTEGKDVLLWGQIWYLGKLWCYWWQRLVKRLTVTLIKPFHIKKENSMYIHTRGWRVIKQLASVACKLSGQLQKQNLFFPPNIPLFFKVSEKHQNFLLKKIFLGSPKLNQIKADLPSQLPEVSRTPRTV